MGDDGGVRASLAYRKSREDIWAGKIPAKFTRLLPYITGSPVLEMGSAEGVLSLLLAARGATVTGVELRPERYEEALRLQQHRKEHRSRFICGDIRALVPGIFVGCETVVAVRTIYYLRRDAADVMAIAAQEGVGRVVLCGNRNREAQSVREPDTDLGKFNHLASAVGMANLLTGAGYRVVTIIAEGDPVVVGTLR